MQHFAMEKTQAYWLKRSGTLPDKYTLNTIDRAGTQLRRIVSVGGHRPALSDRWRLYADCQCQRSANAPNYPYDTKLRVLAGLKSWKCLKMVWLPKGDSKQQLFG